MNQAILDRFTPSSEPFSSLSRSSAKNMCWSKSDLPAVLHLGASFYRYVRSNVERRRQQSLLDGSPNDAIDTIDIDVAGLCYYLSAKQVRFFKCDFV